ncbi:MAG: tripartite tricarboxylate transporter substrate binding protein, partial [Rubrivivax sp.]
RSCTAAGTPAAVQDLLATQIAAAVKAPDVRQKLVESGFAVTGTPRGDAERMVRAEAARWAAVVKATGFKGD